MGERIRMAEIYSLSIQLINPKEQIRVVCEECGRLADYFVNKGGNEKYLCKLHLYTWVKKSNIKYQIRS